MILVGSLVSHIAIASRERITITKETKTE